ncbi:BMP family ABC transporter substrate-binding protein [Metabacillus litoralis]|uniref:BMP family ABC transporter substrate-binding protein n=1 Tax=Metabacillus litoralis TaxID=152268 RepID=A0A5C6W146_9BACI|nr:BMP family protein [Metabacillus litoralis]TXC89495.1 BMP family ABC transporter substrate-binding protein [Metabacillus litoralis]
MKKIFVFLALFTLLLAGCGANETTKSEGDTASEEKSKKIALILPEKIGVNPFFQQMDEGAKKAAEEFGFEFKTIESTDITAIEENLRVSVAEGYDLIITSSFESEDALKKVAGENPDQQFAIIDTTVDLPNVRSVNFREHEAAYLLGATAGLSTKTNTVGMVAAVDIPLLKKWTVAFEEGLKSTNPDAQYLVNYVGSFDDPAKAKELALLQFSKGADFIAGAAAVGDLGVFEAAKEEGFYTAGQDIDRTELDPEHIVLSQLKGTDAVAYETIKAFAEGTYEAGVVAYGLKENGVGLTYVTHDSSTPLNDFVGQEAIDQVKVIKDDIVSGKLEIKNPLEN